MLSPLRARRAFLFANRPHMTSPFTYLKHVRDEFAHIVWPTSQTAIAHTLVVIGLTAAIALFVALLDYGFSLIVSRVAGG